MTIDITPITTAFPGARILIIDDEDKIRRMLLDLFKRVGYQPFAAASGEVALQLLAQQRFDLAILDLNMPGMHGTAVIQAARPLAPDTIFIIMTAYATLDSAITALRCGAADYLFKPCSIRDILQVVETNLAARATRLETADPITLLERALVSLKDAGKATPSVAPEIISGRFLHAPDLTVDTQKQLVVVRGQPIAVTPTEYDILTYLLHHPNQIVAPQELSAHLRDCDFDKHSARDLLRAHINRLRRKIETDPANPVIIRTVRGKGYLFESNI